MAFVYLEWGLFPVILGLVLGGIGVVPIALFATIVEGRWDVFWNVIVLIGLTYGLRALGFWLVEKAAERSIIIESRKSETARPNEVKIIE
jgi:hypothetical protein